MTDDEKRELEKARKEFVALAKQRQYLHHVFRSYASLVALEPNEAGWIASCPYTGQDYDASKFRLQPGGWDHEHCFICMLKIQDGDPYWRSTSDDAFALCKGCYKEHLMPT
jgi:hypothetical protein